RWRALSTAAAIRPGAAARFLPARLGPPLLAFLLACIPLAIAAAHKHAGFLTTGTWFKWDSGWYYNVAQHGYQPLTRCTAGEGGVPGVSLCGNSGWFPGFPMLVGALYQLGLTGQGYGVAISWVLDFVLLAVLWNGYLRRVEGPSRYVALAFAAVAPGGVYLRTAFPMALTALGLLAALLLARERRWVAAGLAGAVAAYSYPTGVLIAPLLALWALMDSEWPDALLSGALAAGGFLAAIAQMWAGSGRADAYFKVQANYSHGITLPFVNWWHLISGHVQQAIVGNEIQAQIEGVLVAVVMLFLTVHVLARLRADRWRLFLLIAGLVLWLAPLTQGNVAYWRSDSLLLAPVSLLVAALDLRRAVAVTGVTLVAFTILADKFFGGGLT
ncbi:MAG: hypothetical protein J2O48_08255, partial [Solirubrobacterales bacterium]|nr:hypothetical protein [Solirubrobacterales bacterium]